MKILIILFTIFLLVSCGTMTTEEIAHEQWKQEQAQFQKEKDRAFKLEQLKIEAEIEKAKPVEVKVQELKNEETTMGEGIQNAVGIAGAVVTGISLLHMMK